VLGHVIDGAASVGSRLPVRVAHGLAVTGGHLEWALRPGKRRRLARNLSRAVGAPAASPTTRRLVRQEMVNEARRSADLLWAVGRPDELRDAIEIVGADHAVDAAARGCGVVLAGIHVGGWEIATGVPGAVLKGPTTVLVADDWLAWAIEHVRTAAGLQIAYRTASTIGLGRRLRRGEALLVLGDDASGGAARRHTVRFCDAWADLPGGTVALARLASAPIVPFTVLPIAPRRWRVTIEAAIEPPDRRRADRSEHVVMQELANRWTSSVRAHPEHWAASFPIAWRDGP
jgi:lauroyl/myristoyl acyltransferase